MTDIRTTPGGGMEAIGFGGSWETVPKAAQQEIERLRESLDMAYRRLDTLADRMLAGEADGGLLGGRQLKRAVPGIFGISPE